jgi:uncharacterized coiled-coil DUF342 family protein
MSPGSKVLMVLVVASLGVWGCAQGPANNANAERIRALETKIAKLEDDFRTAVTARDQLRKRLTTIEEERNQLNQKVEKLQIVVKERDNLRQQLTMRTTERDSAQNQFEQLRKGIKSLLGQSEATAGTTVQPVTSTVEATPAGKS